MLGGCSWDWPHSSGRGGVTDEKRILGGRVWKPEITTEEHLRCSDFFSSPLPCIRLIFFFNSFSFVSSDFKTGDFIFICHLLFKILS